MQVHAKFVLKNKSILRRGVFLGDDMLMIFKRRPDIFNLKVQIATEFNMNSKELIIDNGGAFCSLICYLNIDGRLGMGPDFVRMYHRY